MSRSIKRDFQYVSVTTIVISMVLLSCFWIFLDYKTLQHESSRLHEKYMSEYQEMLSSQVDRIANNIERKQNLTAKKLESEVRHRTLEAHQIITNLFSQNRNSLSKETVRKLSKDILQNIQFNDGRGYYFAINLDGTEGFSPAHSTSSEINSTEGAELQDPNITADILKIAKADGEGLYAYSSAQSDTHSAGSPKIAFIKYIPELEWILGTSEYVNDTIARVQEEISSQVEQIRFGKDNKEYVFIATYDGVGKTYPAKDKSMLEVQDANGMYVVKELIKKAKSGGGFIQYVMPNIEGLKPKAKLSYVAPVPAWEWYIGAGVYIDEIDEIISASQILFKEKVIRHITVMLLVLLGLIGVHSFTTYVISQKIWQQLRLFSTFFHKASTESASIDNTKLIYGEFREIGAMANEMLKEKNAILQEVCKSRDEWLNTFNSIGDCIMVLDANGTIIRANAAAAALHQMPLEQIINTSFNELCHIDNPVNQTLIDHLPHTEEVYNERLNKVFLSSSFPIFIANGEMDRIIHIAHDITEQKNLKEQLVQSQKMEAVGTLAGGIAHDFNNILGAVLGYAELAENDCPKKSITAQHIEQIIKAGNRAKDLVRQILVFSRQAEVKHVPLQPATIVREVLKLLRASLPTTITIEENIGETTGIILADPTQIHQVLMNLATNACHAMEKTGGVLTVSLEKKTYTEQDLPNFQDLQSQDFVQISVQDNGPGIDSEIQEKIFDPYFTTKEKGKGTGMGLAIVHGIINSYDGFISFSSHPESGTVFHINLPLHDKPVMEETEPAPLLVKGTERILFIDDEDMLVEMSKMMLKQLGYDVTAFTSSVEALAAFNRQPDQFDLVITDQTMPTLTGIELATRILERRPDLPIILCTGFSELVSEEKTKSLGIRCLANKPIRMDKLATLIRKALASTT